MIRKIEVRPYFRLYRREIENLSPSDFIEIKTELDEVAYIVQVKHITDRYEQGIGAPEGRPSEHWNSNIANVSASEGLPLWMKDIGCPVPAKNRERKAWIFQGNPDTFEIDRYLTDHDNITWRVKRNKDDLWIGDTVYLWRSQGRAKAFEPGVIARATVTSPVFSGEDDVHAINYWLTEDKRNEVVDRVRLEVQELNRNEGMLRKNYLLDNPILQNLLILKSPQGTTFKLSAPEALELKKNWEMKTNWDNAKPSVVRQGRSDNSGPGENANQSEGDGEDRGSDNPPRKKVERNEYKRSQWVVDQTILRSNFKCEVPDCQIELFKKSNGNNYLEVHHIKTLAKGGPDRIENTVSLCPGHHREIHFGQRSDELTTLLAKLRQ